MFTDKRVKSECSAISTPLHAVAQTPSELAVQGYSNGVNQGTFRGNNKSGSVLYEVWRREGDVWKLAVRYATATSGRSSRATPRSDEIPKKY